MPEKFSDEQASRIIAALDARSERKTRDSAQITTTWATIGEVDAANKYASAYLYGETDGAYMSGGFRIPEAMYLTVGSKVKVAINYATGDRWIEEANFPSSAFKKITIDIANGQVRTGDGASAPTLSLLSGSLLTLGNSVTAGALDIEGGNNANEGGELVLRGSSANTDWNIDNYAGRIRFFVGGSVYLDLSTDRLAIDLGSGLVFGPIGSGDTNLYRSAANVLRTDDEMSVASLVVRKSGANEGVITFPILAGNDPGFIKHIESPSNTGEMRFSVSDDRASTDFFSFGSTPASVWSEALRIRSDGVLEWSGTALERDTNLYRLQANTLMTDDALVVNGTFYVGAGTTAGTSANGVNISTGGSIELYSANPFIDFKISNVDYGARIIYDLNVSDGLEFVGATGGYEFDYDVRRGGEAWVAPTMLNSWTAYGSSFPAARYRKDAQGYVHLSGLIKSGTIGTAAFNLPAGFRPLTHTLLNVSIASGNTVARIDIEPDGDVLVVAGSTTWTSIEGIVFKAEA